MGTKKLLEKSLDSYEFVLAKKIGSGEFQFVKGCKTEEEMRELYKNWLIQSDQDSKEHWPFQRYEGMGYMKMLVLTFEVREELAKKTQGQENQYVM
ncbi:MAG TPA: hypothetical protein ENI22_02345 [Candidatus Pacearchaeota archaeon]|nr:hypothetical protein [Candidatus Pacearchaeota archaeon]